MRRYFTVAVAAMLFFSLSAEGDKTPWGTQKLKPIAPMKDAKISTSQTPRPEDFAKPTEKITPKPIIQPDVKQPIKVIIPDDFDPEQGKFYSLGSAGTQVFASGEDGILYKYESGSTDLAWSKVELKDSQTDKDFTDIEKDNVKNGILYVSGFGSTLILLTKHGDIYKYHWTKEEAEKFLPTTKTEKTVQIKEKKAVKKAVKAIEKKPKTKKVEKKPAKKKMAITKKRIIKKRETVGGFDKKIKTPKSVKIKRSKVKKSDKYTSGKGSPAKSKLRRSRGE